MRKSIESLDDVGRGWGFAVRGGSPISEHVKLKISQHFNLHVLVVPAHNRTDTHTVQDPRGQVGRKLLLTAQTIAFPHFTSALCAVGQDILCENKDSGPSCTAPTLSLSLLRIYDGRSLKEDACLEIKVQSLWDLAPFM